MKIQTKGTYYIFLNFHFKYIDSITDISKGGFDIVKVYGKRVSGW